MTLIDPTRETRKDTNPTNRAIGKRVRDLMWDHKISQVELAQALGETQSAISRRVRGATRWTAEDLIKTARALGVSVGYLFGETQEAPASEETGASGDVHPLGLEPRTHWIRDGRENKPVRPRGRSDRSTGPKNRKR